MPEKPGFLGLRGPGCKPWPETGLPGWERSADRTRLRENSLQTGNFTGNSGILRAESVLDAEKLLRCRHILFNSLLA